MLEVGKVDNEVRRTRFWSKEQETQRHWTLKESTWWIHLIAGTHAVDYICYSWALLKYFSRSICWSYKSPKLRRISSTCSYWTFLWKAMNWWKICEKTNRLNIFDNIRCASQIDQLEKISDCLQYYMPANMFLEVKNLAAERKGFLHFYDLRPMDECQKNETILKRVFKVTKDPRENAIMLR